MRKEEKLKKMNDLFSNCDELTTGDLNGCGFGSTEITKLIEDGVIERISRGRYKKVLIVDYEQLLEQGKILRIQNKLFDAKEIFEKYLVMNPVDVETKLLLVDVNLSLQNYQGAYNILKDLQSVTSEGKYEKELNFYFYLMSLCIELSEEEKSVIKNYPLSLLILDDNVRFDDLEKFNRVIANVYYKKYSRARYLLNDLIGENGLCVEYQLVKKLLNILSVKTKNEYQKINLLIKSDSYDEVLSILEIKQQRDELSSKDKMMLSIVQDIVNLKNNGTIPSIKDVNSRQFKDAVENKDYRLALDLNNKYYESKRNVVDNDLLRILLININTMIDNQKEVLRKKKEEESVATFSDVVQCLLKQDVDSVYIKLHSYLKSINKEQYEFLLIDLIKISALENDKIFTKPMMALTYISKDNFKFDIDTYVQNFYESVSKNELKKAQVYLDILSKSRNIGYEFNAADLLNQVLDSSFEMLDDSTDKEEVNEDATTKQPDVTVTEVVHDDKKEENTSYVSSSIGVKKYDPNRDFIEHKLLTLREDKGIIILKHMPIERRRKLHKIIRDIPEMSAFSIGQDDNRRMVLRYIEQEEKIDIKATMEQGNEYFREQKYTKSLEEYQKLLRTGKPPHFVYSRIGLLLLKLQNKDKAVQYLTVGNELAKQVNSTYDFTDLINNLTGVIAEEDKKAYVKMTEQDFNEKTDDYGINGLTAITDYAYRHQTDIDESCQIFDLSQDEVNIVKIMVARHNYGNDHYELGDKIMKQVERSEEKSPLVKSLFKETVQNKKFYRNRNEETSN